MSESARAFWSSLSAQQAALAILMASVASAVLAAAIVADRPRRYLLAVVFGLAGGILLRLTPAGHIAAQFSEGWYQWTIQPLVGVLFALGWCAVTDALLSSRIPLIREVRPRGRRALRSSRWGTAEEIGERAGMDPAIVRLFNVSVEAPEMTAWRQINRLRIAAHVFSGSLVGLFFAVPAFREALAHNFTAEHIAINLVGTLIVTFFIGPLHEQMLLLSGGPHTKSHADEHHVSERLVLRQVLLFFAVAVLLFLLQAVHSAAHEFLQKMTLYTWILLLEVCALPLIVTTYYFGVALYHGGLGERRWDRALEASVWFGAIALLPFALVIMLSEAFPAGLQDSLLSSITRPGQFTVGLVMQGMLHAYVALLIAAALAVVGSIGTYGVYAAALGVAMLDAPRATVRRRAWIAVLIAGLIAQLVTSAFTYFTGLLPPQAHRVQIALAAGWALGLHLSRFEREMVESAKPAPRKPAIATE